MTIAALTIFVWKAGALTILHEWLLFFGSLWWVSIVAVCFDHLHVHVKHEKDKEVKNGRAES